MSEIWEDKPASFSKVIRRLALRVTEVTTNNNLVEMLQQYRLENFPNLSSLTIECDTASSDFVAFPDTIEGLLK